MFWEEAKEEVSPTSQSSTWSHDPNFDMRTLGPCTVCNYIIAEVRGRVHLAQNEKFATGLDV